MGRLGRKDDAPRVVGFDFGAPPPVPASYVPDPAAPPPPPPPAPPPAEYATVLTEAPPVTYVRSGYVPPQPLPAAPPARTRSGIKREATVLLVLLLVLGVVGGVLRLRSGSAAKATPVPEVSLPPVKLPTLLEDLNAPGSIGGERRFVTPMRLPIVRALHRMLPNNGRFAEIEVYGDSAPRYAIVAGAISKGDSRRVYAVITRGAAPGSLAGPRTFAGGVLCADDRDGSGDAFCVWGGNVSDGFVMRYGPGNLAALARTTVQARRDLERGH